MANIGSAITPAPVITCYTQVGGIASGYSGDVTVALSSNPTGAVLGGTLTVAASSGVATFSDLTVSRSGAGFRLSATASGLKTASSALFSIPTSCVFTTQPSYTPLNTVIPAVSVTVRDSGGSPDTAYNGTITVALYSASAAGTLSGTKSVSAVAGVATFDTLQIDVAGTYSLIATATEVATAYKPSAVVSDSFYVGPYTLTSADLGSNTFGKDTISGSIVPATFGGATVRQLKTAYAGAPAPDAYTTTFALSGIHSQNLFTSISVNGFTFTSSSATFSGSNTWEWQGSSGPLTTTGDFEITFT